MPVRIASQRPYCGRTEGILAQRRAAALSALLTIAAASPLSAAIQILSMGTLSGYNDYSADSIAADGSAATGFAGDPGGLLPPTVFRWTQGGGMVAIGGIADGALSGPPVISGDGKVIVGLAGDSGMNRAFRWTIASGIQDLGALPGGTVSRASATNHNGSVVFGTSNGTGGGGIFRWTTDSGMQPLGLPLGHQVSGCNDEGTVVSGTIEGSGGTGAQAFRWSVGAGVENLGFLPGGSASYGTAISRDGSAVVGFGFVGFESRAFRWTEAEGMRDLGILEGGFVSEAYALSANGSVVVGQSGSSNGFHATIWTQQLGLRRLDEYLASLGADLTGWDELSSAYGVSADGSVIVGRGSFNGETRAWIAIGVPGPHSATSLAMLGVILQCRRRRAPAP